MKGPRLFPGLSAADYPLNAADKGRMLESTEDRGHTLKEIDRPKHRLDAHKAHRCRDLDQLREPFVWGALGTLWPSMKMA